MRHLVIGFALLFLLPAAGVGGWQLVTLDTLGSPQRVRVANLEADALPDAVYIAGSLAPRQPHQLVVLRNLGGAQLKAHWRDVVISDLGDNGVALEVADVDEDGLNDLLLGNLNGTGGFTYRLGDGSGRFPDETFGPSFGGYVDDISVVDYDNDGHLDVGTTTFDLGPYVDRFDGNGAGGFGTGLPFASYIGVGVAELASADLTGDGLANDVVTGEQGLMFFDQGQLPSKLVNRALFRAALADYDGDGLADIAATAPLDNALLVLRSLGGGQFGVPRGAATGRRPAGLVPLDVDLDGDLDLAVCNSGSRSVSLMVNDGAGVFMPSERLGVGSGPSDLAAADLDADGDIDLVVANAGDDTLSVLLNPLN